jgi:hypothetical protein
LSPGGQSTWPPPPRRAGGRAQAPPPPSLGAHRPRAPHSCLWVAPPGHPGCPTPKGHAGWPAPTTTARRSGCRCRSTTTNPAPLAAERTFQWQDHKRRWYACECS